MNTEPIWAATSVESDFPVFTGDLETDVVIVGGGIAGITAALTLSEAGKSVVVLEAMQVGLGTTGYSTGNLYATVDSYLYQIRKKWDREMMTAVVRSREETVGRMEEIARRRGVTCDFRRCPQYIFPTNAAQHSDFEQEHDAMREAGMMVTLAEVPLPFAVGRGLKLENQAQFHPLAYVRGMAKSIASDRCRIFENSKVVDIEYDALKVTTGRGTVKADKIILATHTPKGFNVIQTELGPYREYGIATTLEEAGFPEGIFWTMEEPSHSLRSCRHDGKDYLIVIGEKHKTGQHDPDVDYFARVEDFCRAHFKVRSVDYRWSAQHYRPADHLPYIGRTAASGDVFIATGFGTDGLTYGSLAAFIISDAIVGRHNPWHDLYRAMRFDPVKGAKDFVQENINVATQYVKDYLTKALVVEPAEIGPGEGGIVKINGEKVAVCRDENGKLTAVSPVCTHLGCLVHWNKLEKSWDCPCHGSRFRPDGEVIEGPAIPGLERKELPEGL